jgi:hypothetical protein
MGKRIEGNPDLACPALPPIHLKPKFSIGQFVYPRADPDQYPRIITGLIIRPNEIIKYLASNYDNEREYEAFELSDVKTYVP